MVVRLKFWNLISMSSGNFANADQIYLNIRESKKFKTPFVIAIDGPDCSGKSHLAETIRRKFHEDGFDAVIEHIDDTYTKNVVRPRSNTQAVSEFILEFFTYDHLSSIVDKNVNVLIIEGLFLLRPQLIRLFDYSIRLELSEKDVFERALLRDIADFESWGDFADHYISQTIAAQRLYRWFCNPSMHADQTVNLSKI